MKKRRGLDPALIINTDVLTDRYLFRFHGPLKHVNGIYFVYGLRLYGRYLLRYQPCKHPLERTGIIREAR